MAHRRFVGRRFFVAASACIALVTTTSATAARPHADHIAPTAPKGLHVVARHADAISLGWRAAHDNNRVKNYQVALSGMHVATVTSTSATLNNLPCQSTFPITVVAVDVAGNHSAASSLVATTVACTPADDPGVELAAGIDGSVVRDGAVLAAQTHGPGVGAVQFLYCTAGCALRDAIVLGSDSSAPYSLKWSPEPSDGTYTVFARALDRLGTTRAVAHAAISVDNTAPAASITSGPSDPTTATSASLAFNSSEFDVQFECSRDGGAFSSCSSPFAVDGLGLGLHTFAVRAIDRAGNVGAAATRFWTVQAPVTPTAPLQPTAPDTAIASAPSGLVRTKTASISFTGSSGSAFECSTDGAAFAACTSPVALASLAEGAHTFQVRAVRSGLTDATPASATWMVDSVAPVLSGASLPALTKSRSLSVSFAVDDSAAVVTCKVDNGAPSVCTSPFTTSTVSDGQHTLLLTATDAAGNSSSLTRTWSVDGTAPVITADALAGRSNSASLSLHFGSDDPAAVATCALDGAAAAPCASPFTASRLADGSHSFTVTLTDAAGNSSSVTRTWTVDTVSPVITLDPVASPTGQRSVSIAFSVDDATAAVTCRLDAHDPVTCTSPFTASALADGPHALVVTATDAAGNVAFLSRAWTVDATAPAITAETPVSPTTSRSISIGFSSDDPSASATCRLDGGSALSCTSPFTASGLADGSHTLTLTLRDAVGNSSSATRTWTVDTTAPVITADTPAALTNSRSISLSFSSDDSTATATCRPDAAAAVSCTSPFTASGLADGPHSVTITFIDAAGNSASVTRTWTVDTTAPVITADTPAALTSSRSVSIGFHSDDSSASATCRLDAGSALACTSPFTAAGLADGSHTLTLTLHDAAGNSSSVTRTWTVDTTPPVITAATPAALTNSRSISLAFASDDPAATATCRLDGGSPGSCTTPFSATGLADGPHSVTITLTDVVGNSSSVTRTWSVDTVSPVVTLDPVASPTNQRSVSIGFAVDDASAAVTCRLDAHDPVTCASPFTASALADGSHTLVVTATDAAGNVGFLSRSWTVDATAPVITADTPAALTSSRSVSIGFSSDDAAASASCRLDSGTAVSCTSPFTASGLADGTHSVTITLTDLAGNSSSVTRTWTVDTTAPVITAATPAALTNSRSISLSFGSDDPAATATCQLDTGPTLACTSPFTASGLADGAHTVTITLTDAAGNHSFVDRTWTVDTTAPVITADTPAALTSSRSVSIGFSSDDSSASATCRLDGGSAVACTSPFTASGLADGAHRLTLTLSDSVGNSSSVTRTWTVDTTPPVITAATPASPTNSRSVSVGFGSDDPAAVATCAFDGAAAASCTSPFTASGLADGSHSVTITLTDVAGNSSSVTRTWTVDTVSPVVTLDPVASPTNQRSVSIGFSVDDATASITCRLDAHDPVACTSPFSATGLAEGPHTLVVTAGDIAGNVASLSRTWTIDATAPTISADALSGFTKATSVSLAFSVDEPASVTCSLDGGSPSSCTSPFQALALGDGGHTLKLTATDLAGNVSTLTRTWTVDTQPPVLSVGTISSPTNATVVSLPFTVDDSSATVTCAATGHPAAACSSPFVITGLGEGAATAVIAATDLAGNTSTVTRDFVVDRTAPALAAGQLASPTNSASVSLAFTVDDATATVTCKLDAADAASCASPFEATGLADGDHTIVVTAVDAAGNSSTLTRTWSIDTTSPVIHADALSGTTSSRSVSLAFTVDDAGASVTCKLDSADAAPCSSPFVASGLADGSHTLTVTAVDGAGNSATVTRTWTVDATPPVITADALSGTTSSSSLSLGFSTDDPTASLTCTLDSGTPVTPCSSPFTATGLADGRHSLSITATDAAGNVGSLSRDWTIDTTPPETTISSGPDMLTNATTADFTLSSESGAHFECSTDAAAFGACDATVHLTTLGAGRHTFAARAIDAAGNVDATPATWTWTIDLSAPSVLLSVQPGTNAAHQLFNSSSMTFYFNPAGAGDATIVATPGDDSGIASVRLLGATTGGFTATAATLTSAPFTFPVSFADGATGAPAVLTVRVTDTAGNTTDGTIAVVRDVAGPTGGSISYPSGFTNNGNVTITADAGTDNGAGISGYSIEASKSVLASGTCRRSPGFSPLQGTSDTLTTPTCAQYRVVATDKVGNSSTTTGAGTLEYDGVPPSVTIGTLASVVSGSVSLSATAQDAESGLASTVFSVAPAGSGLWSPLSGVTWDTTGLSDGSYDVKVVATDQAGNSASDTATTTVDNQAPTVSIASPADGATVHGTVSVSATASDAGSGISQVVLEDAPTGGSYTTLATIAGGSSYSTAWDTTTVADGSYTLRAIATDKAGHITNSAEITVTVAQPSGGGGGSSNFVDVGPGYTEASTRAVVRTKDDRVIIFAADDTAQKQGTGPGVLRAYGGDQAGVPTSFSELDGAHRPTGQVVGGTDYVLEAPDVRLDDNGIAHLLYIDDASQQLIYQTFSTVTNTWGTSEVVATGINRPHDAFFQRGSTANSLVLDASGGVHIVYAAGADVWSRDLVGGSWTSPVRIATGYEPMHTSLVADAAGNLYLTWFDMAGATTPTIYYAEESGGSWGAPEVVAGPTDPLGVLANNNLDQGPSIALTADGTPTVLYVSASQTVSGGADFGVVQIKRRISGTWTLDPTAEQLYTHTPQIYTHGNDIYAFLGHDLEIRFGYAYQSSDGTWAPYTPLTSVSDGAFDGSANLRYDPLHDNNPNIIDAAFFNEDRLHDHTFQPELYYIAVPPATSGPSSDTTPPTVGVDTPHDGDTVSGSTPLSATATDDVGVISVQFEVDGTLVGTKIKTPPYATTFDTTSLTNGTHTIQAVAKDAAGNTTVSSAVTVTVSNTGTQPPPPPPPTFTFGTDTLFSNVDNNPAGVAEAFQAAVTGSGSIAALHLYIDAASTASSVVVGIYGDSGGDPGALLAQATIAAPTSGGWNTVALPSPLTVSDANAYWVAILAPSGTIQFRDDSSTTGKSEASSETNLTALPATWTAGTVFPGGAASLYGSGS